MDKKDKLTPARRVGGRRVKAIRRGSGKGKAEETQDPASNAPPGGSTPVEPTGEPESKSRAVAKAAFPKDGNSNSKQNPANYYPPAKQHAFKGTKMVNAKARQVQQPRKHNSMQLKGVTRSQ